MKQFFLIDGFAFLYRAYYAFPEMKNFDGKNMNAVYGFLRMLLKRLGQHPEYLMIARDSPEKTFRHEEFADYKAHRKKMEDDFKDQIPLLREIIEKLTIPSLAISGYEADDILASLVQTYQSNPELSLMLYSGDKDLKQLLTSNVSLVDPVKDVPYSQQHFLEEFGFEPQYFVDYLALLGDQADNIKGVYGIGEKKAMTLIYQYHTIENIYQHLDFIDPIITKALSDGKESAFASKKLVQLAQIDLSHLALDTLKFTLDYPYYEEVLCNQYGFVSLRKTLAEMKRAETMPQQLGLF
ncbi:MAG: hypothetical protein LBP53_07975 [Candidatus Peribacteria bacterium]|jgi:DNA polymerase-1|nr:hypothetical protein [Candidatus Peribacteria bacterium]